MSNMFSISQTVFETRAKTLMAVGLVTLESGKP